MRNIFDKVYKKAFLEFNELLNKLIEQNQKKVIVTANPETFIIANNNSFFYNNLLKDEVIIVPDGIGIVKGGKKLGYSINERLPGIEIVSNLLAMANQYSNKTLYLYGAKNEVIIDMKKYIENNYSNISIVGVKDGYNYNEEEVFKEIINLSPDIIMIGLGIPKQEELIFKYLEEFNKGIFIGVGGSFDVLSGHKKRAPKIFIKLNLEWLYRIIREPKRIKKFYQNNIKFIFLINKLKKDQKVGE